MRPAIVLLLFASIAFAEDPADKAKADQLRKEIAELKARLAAKEDELSKLAADIFDPRRTITFLDLTVGEVGDFIDRNGRPGQEGVIPLEVFQIIDDGKMIVTHPRLYRPFIAKGSSTKGLAERKVVTLNGVWKVTGTEKYLGTTYYVVEPIKIKPPPVVNFKLPGDFPKVPDVDGNDPRPLVVREWARASQVSRDMAKIPPDISKILKPADAQKLREATTAWQDHERELRLAAAQQKAALEKDAKAKLVKQAEDTWPVPKGATTLDRAKIEAKQTAWIKEHLPPLLEKIAKDYKLD